MTGSLALISGIGGFLGSALARRLLQSAWHVVGVEREGADLSRLGDIQDQLDIFTSPEQAFSHCRDSGRPEAIIHTATLYGRSGESISAMIEANLSLGGRLLQRAAEVEVPLFLNIGTSLPRQTSAYALSKHQFVEWGRLLTRDTNTRFLTAVLEHFYGPGDSESKFTTFLIHACLNGVEGVDLTPGEQKRDFIYLDDAVSALEILLQRSDEIPDEVESVPIGTGSVVTIREFARLVQEITGGETELRFGARPYRIDEPMESVADLAVMRRLGWSPEVDLREGISRTVEGDR